MLTGKTKSGFKYAIDERIKTDWRLIKLLGALNSADETQMQACVDLLAMLFKDKGEALEKHVAKQNDGYIPINQLMEEVAEILASNPVAKK